MRRRLSDIKTSLTKLFSSEKGSSTILLAILLTTMMTITVSFVILAQEKSQIGKIDSIMAVAGRSVLSEYSIPLKDRYGLLAVDMTPVELGKRLEFYGKINDNKLKMDRMSVKTRKYSLANFNHLEEEIVEYYKFLMGKNLLDRNKKPDISSNKESQYRTLRNINAIETLPSKEYSSGGFNADKVAESLKNVDGLFDKSKKSVVINSYILEEFSNYMKDLKEETFFKNEVEYIIAGKKSDSYNHSVVKNRIVLARNVINLGVIMQSPSMMAKVDLVASLAGPASPAAKLALAESWALAESLNDYKVLIHGGKVPVVKTRSDWCVRLEGVAEGVGQGYINNHSNTGMTYEDYLMVLLSFCNREGKLARMLDLMQLNIQGTYDRDFLILTSQTGFSYSVRINGREYQYEEKY